MKINKEKLEALCALDDDALWREVRKIAASYGVKLPENTPPHSEMQKMRDATSGGLKMNLSEALKIINNQRREKK